MLGGSGSCWPRLGVSAFRQRLVLEQLWKTCSWEAVEDLHVEHRASVTAEDLFV